jgi:hypothetical protein
MFAAPPHVGQGEKNDRLNSGDGLKFFRAETVVINAS